MSNYRICSYSYIVANLKAAKNFNSDAEINIVANGYRLTFFSCMLLTYYNSWSESAVTSNLCSWLDEYEITSVKYCKSCVASIREYSKPQFKPKMFVPIPPD